MRAQIAGCRSMQSSALASTVGMASLAIWAASSLVLLIAGAPTVPGSRVQGVGCRVLLIAQALKIPGNRV